MAHLTVYRPCNCIRTSDARFIIGFRGFTLIEITIVLALVGVLLLFAIPRFQDTFLVDPTLKPTRWLMVVVPELRSSAIRNQRTVSLHVDLSENRLWSTHSAEQKEARELAEKNAYHLSEGVRLTGVVFANGKKQTVDIATIQFHSQGWADRAIILMESDNQDRFSFEIKPFLTVLERVEGYQDFDTR